VILACGVIMSFTYQSICLTTCVQREKDHISPSHLEMICQHCIHFQTVLDKSKDPVAVCLPHDLSDHRQWLCTQCLSMIMMQCLVMMSTAWRCESVHLWQGNHNT